MLDTLSAALEREHREIDAGIEVFAIAGARGQEQAGPLRQAMSALRRHIFLEEVFVFPPLRDTGLVAPIFVMLREHGEIWDAMDAIEAQLNGDSGGRPSDELCRQLLSQLERHNSKEEAIIYRQADAVLGADMDTELRVFLAAGQMPDRWMCEQAGA